MPGDVQNPSAGELGNEMLRIDPVASAVPLRTSSLLIHPVIPFNAGILITSTSDIPRNAVTVPVSPTTDVTDTVLFESADGTQKFYVPRYDTAVQQTVSGKAQYRIAFQPASNGIGSTLTIHLTKSPASELGDSARNATEIKPTLVITLRHLIEKGGSQLKEWLFQEIIDEPGGVVATLRLSSQPDTDLVYNALSQDGYDTRLYVHRTITVAVPVPPTATLVSSGTAILKGTWTFDFDTGAEGPATGADVWWDQQTDTLRQMVAVSGAQLYNIGVTDFDTLSAAQLQGLAYSTAAIPGNNDATNRLVNGDVFAVKTNAGNYAKVQVTNYGYDLSIRWVTYQFSASSTPTITTQAVSIALPMELLTSSVHTTLSPRFMPLMPPRDGGGDGPEPLPHPLPHPIPHPVPVPSPPAAPPPAPVGPLYRVISPTLDNIIQPFWFNPDLHSYIFQGITGKTDGGGSNLVSYPVTWKNQVYHYYQDSTRPYLFHILPDSYKLVRKADVPHVPFIDVQFTTPDGTLDKAQVTFIYAAAPYVDTARLEDAAQQLNQQSITGPLPSGISGPVFDHLLVDTKAIQFLLTLPGTANPTQARPGVVTDLWSPFHDIVSPLTLQDFSTTFGALFDSSAVFLQGKVVVELGADQNKQTETIPFIAQADDLIGDIFAYSDTPDGTGGIKATFLNAIESPIQINKITAHLHRGSQATPELTQVLPPNPPAQLAPVRDSQPPDQVTFDLMPTGSLPGTDPLVVSYDLDDVKVQVDRQAILTAALSSARLAVYDRTITVQASAVTFGTFTRPDGSTDAISSVVVDFEHASNSVQLKSSHLSEVVTLHLPISDYVQAQMVESSYRYKISVYYNGGKSSLDANWRTGSSGVLDVTQVGN